VVSTPHRDQHGLRAALYTRRSALDERLGRSVSEQEDAGRRDCARNGWLLSETAVYTDDGRSASRFATRRRDDWHRLVGDLEAGDYDLLWIWESDRGSRELEEWAGLLNRCRRLSILIHVSTHHRTYDPRIGRDWRNLAEDGVDAAYASEKMSVNLQRAFAARAQKGEPHGFVPWGWRREVEYDDRGRRITARDVIVDDEGAVIREATARVIAGESLRSICRELNRREIAAPRAGAWSATVLRQVLTRPRNAGLQVHRKEIIGRGNWEPILSDSEFNRCLAILTDPTRKVTTGREVRFLLSGIARCGLCGGPMRTLVPHGKLKRRYGCSECFRVVRNQAAVDGVITELVTRRLALPDAIAALTPDGVDIQPSVDELAVLRSRLNVAADQYAEGAIDGAQLVRITAALKPRIEALESEVKAAVSRPELADLARHDIAEHWRAVPLERKRLAIQTLLELRILPVRKRGRGSLDPEDLVVTWRSPVADEGLGLARQ
jgi:site-specific DNA recombinase